MASLLQNIEHFSPGLWTEFCQCNGDETRWWTPAVGGEELCLDRDWRKIVFKLLDYVLESRQNMGLEVGHHRPDSERLKVIVHPACGSYS